MSNGQSWLIEIVKIGESEAAAAATQQHGPYVSRKLRTPAAGATKDKEKQSTEGELLLVEQKIAEKVMRDCRPTKFPKPNSDFHMIIIDTRSVSQWW
ncbi:MAG: hypothetical protein JOZ29_06940 [Deltaproteobacteria bacterium]|nr:hypothetical protein [Deltaproteobacteria bacterium]